MWFTRASIKNPVFATMMMAACLVLGLFAYQRLSIDQFPNVNFPVVVVQTEYPGASPESVETDITRKIEEAVNTISGLKTLASRSYEGLSVVIAEFQLTVDPVGSGDTIGFKVTSTGTNAKVPQSIPPLLAGGSAEHPVDAHAIQPFYTSLLAKNCGLSVGMAAEGDAVVVTAS